MTEEPSTAAVAAESLPLTGREHRERGKHLAQVSPNLMHTQKTHLQHPLQQQRRKVWATELWHLLADREGSRKGMNGHGSCWCQEQNCVWASSHALLPPSFLVISLQLSPKQHLRRTENTDLLKKKPWVLLLTLLLFYNEETGARSCQMLMVHTKASLRLLKALVAHRSPASCGNRKETQCVTPPFPKADDPARNSFPSQLPGWAEPSFTTSQPLWQGVSQGEERQTHPATDRESILHAGAGKEASSTAFHTDVWPPTARQKPQVEVLVHVLAAARYIGHPVVKHNSLRWRFPYLPSKT